MIKHFIIGVGILLFAYGCYVGAKVHVKSDHLLYPVSYTKSFYTHDFDLVGANDYKIVKHFSFSFTKWGISAPLNIGSEEEISENLNQVIRDNNGDALVNLVISVNSAPFNSYLKVPKIVSFWVGLASITLLISDPTKDHAALAAGAIAVYLFTPGAATVTIEGDVVKITGDVR